MHRTYAQHRCTELVHITCIRSPVGWDGLALDTAKSSLTTDPAPRPKTGAGPVDLARCPLGQGEELMRGASTSRQLPRRQGCEQGAGHEDALDLVGAFVDLSDSHPAGPTW
jgi:hypothetical protein